ncbi:unnamed protein product [Calypogeia fissa]
MAGVAVPMIIQPSTSKVESQQRRKCVPQKLKSKCVFSSWAFGAKSSSKNVHLKLTRIFSHQTKAVSTLGAIAVSPVSNVGGNLKSLTNFRISETFEELRKKRQVAFIPYLTAGDPNLETTAAAVKLLEQCGADIIELGVPYSDPLADGPVIQAAATRAISGGTNLDSVLTLMREGLSDIKVPIVLFLYYNPLLKRGVQKFLAEAKAAGASGLVVPDLPLEETTNLRKLTSVAGLELILLTTPTTPTVRMRAIADASQGFVYLVSLTGVTGARASIDARVEDLVKNIKKASDKPVAVGFGVSTAEQAAKLAEWGADGVIIGSTVVKLLGESGSPETGLKAVKEFAIEVRAALAPTNRPLSPHD